MLSSIIVIFNTVGPQNINSPRYCNMSQTGNTATPNSSLILMVFLMVVLKLLWPKPCHSTFNHYHSSKTWFRIIHFNVMFTHHFIKCVVSPWSFPTEILHATLSAIIPTIHLDNSGWNQNFILVSFSEYIIFLIFNVCNHKSPSVIAWFHFIILHIREVCSYLQTVLSTCSLACTETAFKT